MSSHRRGVTWPDYCEARRSDFADQNVVMRDANVAMRAGAGHTIAQGLAHRPENGAKNAARSRFARATGGSNRREARHGSCFIGS